MSSRLVKLAPELLQFVIQHTHPSSHFAFALTCRYIYQHSGSIFERHRAAYKNGRIASDISTEKVLELLHLSKPSCGAEGIEAWHVRELEIWGTRPSWSEWRHWDLRDPDHIMRFGSKRSAKEEVMHFLDYPPFMQRVAHLYTEEVNDDCLRGDDGYIKMLLITSLPRLQELRFAKRLSDQHSSLRWLGKAVSQALETGNWPPGLKSLRKVAVGISTNHNEDILVLTRRPVEFARLMCLPNLEELYFSHLHAEEEESDDDDYPSEANGDANDGETGVVGNDLAESFLSPNSSNVRSLILDNISCITSQLLECIAQAPKSLQSFVVRGLDDTIHPVGDMDQLVSSLTESQSDSLEKLLFYNPHGLAGFPFSVYTPSYMGLFDNLRIANIDLNDAEAFAIEVAASKNTTEGSKGFLREFAAIFPDHLEAVAFLGTSDDDQAESQGDERIRRTEDAMVAMVESDRLGSLKGIYIHYADLDTSDDMDDVFSWPKVTEAGRRGGVGVHTPTNNKALDVELEFVGMPDKFDLKSGQYGQRDENWVVNKYTGNWVLRD